MAYTDKKDRTRHDRAKLEKDPALNRRCHFKRLYGITLEQRDEIIRRQDGRCPICHELLIMSGKSRHSAVIDHNHQTGRVRSVLCSRCNKGIGHFSDSVKLLQASIHYLTQYKDF